MIKKTTKIGVNVLKLLLSANFIMVGSMKVIGVEDAVNSFVHYGYPAWFCTVVGTVEIAAGICLWVGKLTKYALAALFIVMGGALVTHILFKEVTNALVIGVYLLLLVTAALARRQVTIK